jgi:DNA-binding response OmpR family regulator
MSVGSPDADACPHCRSSLSAMCAVAQGPYSHHPNTGFHVDGRRLKANGAVHVMLGLLLRSDGRPVADQSIADAAGHRGPDAGRMVANLAWKARAAFQAMGAHHPFERIWGEGTAWTTRGRVVTVGRDRMEICPSCGYDLSSGSTIESGCFGYDPTTGLAHVDGRELRATPRMHALLGTFMRGKGEVIPSYVVAERLGSESDNPNGLVRALVSQLRRAVRGHGVDLPVECLWGSGYRWTEDAAFQAPRYYGPEMPARIRRGVRTGPDLTDLLLTPEEGTHACGCPLDTPAISSDGWSWNDRDGLHLSGSAIAVPPVPGRVVAMAMAASGMYVHASKDLGDVIGGNPERAREHLNVIMFKLRGLASEHGVTMPMAAKHCEGVRWTAGRPQLETPDAGSHCRRCSDRERKVSGLTGAVIVPVKHPGTLRGTRRLIADLLSAMPGRIVSNRDIMDLIGTSATPKIVTVYLCGIRRCYHEAGLGNPIRNHWGLGYEWLDTPEERIGDRAVAKAAPGSVRRQVGGRTNRKGAGL